MFKVLTNDKKSMTKKLQSLTVEIERYQETAAATEKFRREAELLHQLLDVTD